MMYANCINNLVIILPHASINIDRIVTVDRLIRCSTVKPTFESDRIDFPMRLCMVLTPPLPEGDTTLLFLTTHELAY